eukprot:gene28410-35210_t
MGGADSEDEVLTEDEVSDEEEIRDTHGKLAYLSQCETLGLTPVSQINSNLTVLRLGDNNLGPEGTSVVCEALLKNTCVQELDLSENHLGTAPIGLGRETISKLLSAKPTGVHSLHLRANKLSDADAVVLSEVLSENRTLTYLDLSINTFGEKAGLALGNMLHSGTKLKELNLGVNLGWNGVSDDGFSAIGEALAVNSAVVEIIL